jgi:hypothetical protein
MTTVRDIMTHLALDDDDSRVGETVENISK